MQALMLAAGMGRRLGKYTEAQTKCMIEVGGRTLLDRAAESLKLAGVNRLIMVVGWEGDKLVQYARENLCDLELEFVYNYDYECTNNIYSLYMARDWLAQDDTLLLESDLIFAPDLLEKVVLCPNKNVAVVAKYQQWMDGTVVTLGKNGDIQEFIEKKDFLYRDVERYYKTTNIYKFSKEFSTNQYLPFLQAYITAYGKNQYYETVLKAISHLAKAQLKAFILEESIPWYEIDDAQDLDIANTLFAKESDRLAAYEQHYGGYWRFPAIKDFCYLVNPYFPPQKMLDQMKYFFDPLLMQYPSGMNVQRLIAGKMYQIEEDYLLIGNGAAELIETLGRVIHKKTALSIPAFHEYIRCFRNCELVFLYTEEDSFQLKKERLLQAIDQAETLVLINPDNPSGSFLSYSDLLEILTYAKLRQVRCIIDESFLDFAQAELRYTLLQNDLLKAYPNLVVIKSISKTYGVPGLRLGVLATSDTALLATLKELLPIWNINSFAEYFLQIYPLYAAGYQSACNKIVDQRIFLESELKKIPYLIVYPSQANYIMCKVKPPYQSKELATQLLIHHNLLIKDLSEKTGMSGGQYIRVAVKNEEENAMLIRALRTFIDTKAF